MARQGPVHGLFVFFISFLLRKSMAQNCVTDTFSQNLVFAACDSLPYLGAVVHWTYHPSNATIDVAYRAPQSSNGWIAWGLNPTSAGMVGTQALIAFMGSDGTMKVDATALSSTSPAIADGKLSFPVISKAAEYSSGGVMTIYATVGLPGNKTQINHAWQAGTTFSGGVPAGHDITGNNSLSSGSINFFSGQIAAGGLSSIQHRKNIHGVLNVVSWGILMPIGVIMARYVRVFADPAWFYLHAVCQCAAYIIGVAGWGTGLKLGSDTGVTYHSHRAIGIILFCLATLQVFALLLRPKPTHKYRIYWNVYHRGVGYVVLVLSVVNIFKGFNILDPAKKWKHSYIGILIGLSGLTVALEAITWAVVLTRKKSEEKPHNGGMNGGGAYGSRPTYGA